MLQNIRPNMDEAVAETDRSGTERGGHSVYSAVSIIGVAFFLAFVCYGGTDGLQTTTDGHLPRSYVMVVVCITSVVSSVLLAPAFVTRLSPNTALCVAWGSHALYAMANLYPTAGTLLSAAVVVGVTFPAVAVAQGVYTTALVDRWCGRLAADAGGEDEMRLQADVDGSDRSPRAQSCGCTSSTMDVNLRRQNAFVFFNSVIMACMAAGNLCGIIITPLLIGSSADVEASPMTPLPDTAAAFNCSVNGSDVGCITRLDGSTFHTTTTVEDLTTTRITTMGGADTKLSCGVNKCPYIDRPLAGNARSTPSTWHALIFVLLCNAACVVLTALLPSLLSGNVRRSTPPSTASPRQYPRRRWHPMPLDDDGYRMVDDAGSRAADSLRRNMLATLYLFVDRRMLMLAPTIVVIGLSGSFTVAAFHQSFAGCDSETIGRGTSYQRAAFIVTTLLTGQLSIHLIRRRTIVLAVLLAAVFIVASTLTWQSRSSDLDRLLIVIWCVINGAVAGALRAAVYVAFPALFGRDRLVSALLHANLWDSVGAALAVLVSDWLCLVIRAWFVIFAAGTAAVGYASLECTCISTLAECSESRSGASGRSVVVGTHSADRESLASVCVSPSEAGSLSTISSNRLSILLHPFANRAYYRPTYDATRPTN